MTVFTAIRRAALRADGAQLDEAFASTEQIAVEMCDLANSVAESIADSADWRALTRVATFVGDATQTEFDKPEGYDRMTIASQIVDGQAWLWGYYAVPSVDEWIIRKRQAWLMPGAWIMLDDKFQFWPAPAGQADFPYVTNLWARSETGQAKTGFDRDNDTFFLGDEVLTAGILYRWLEQKGMDSAAEKAAFEVKLSELQARDKGSQVIRSNTNYFGNLPVAWPWTLG